MGKLLDEADKLAEEEGYDTEDYECRGRIVHVLGSSIYDLVRRLDDELHADGEDCISFQEFAAGVWGAHYVLVRDYLESETKEGGKDE